MCWQAPEQLVPARIPRGCNVGANAMEDADRPSPQNNTDRHGWCFSVSVFFNVLQSLDRRLHANKTRLGATASAFAPRATEEHGTDGLENTDSMGFLKWWMGRGSSAEDNRLRAWRAGWAQVAASPAAERIERLRIDLDGMGLSADEIEIEREMLDALMEREALASAVRLSGLPSVVTGHRVVGAERCHFTAPASMPDEPGQPGGRLLLTSGRAIFVGGANGVSAAWHSVGDAHHLDRDVVLVRSDRDRIHRFRCNTFGDAMRAAFIARALVAARRAPRLVL